MNQRVLTRSSRNSVKVRTRRSGGEIASVVPVAGPPEMLAAGLLIPSPIQTREPGFGLTGWENTRTQACLACRNQPSIWTRNNPVAFYLIREAAGKESGPE